MSDVYLPLLRLLPIEAGDDLKIYAVNGRIGQIMPPGSCNRDAYFSVQQGRVQLSNDEGVRILQPHESALLPSGDPFQLECLTDCRAKLIMPVQASLAFDLLDTQES